MIEADLDMKLKAISEASKSDLYSDGCCKEFVGQGYKVQYINNHNYGGGRANGCGAGLYAQLQLVGISRDIKLSY